ncbi:hypothetical protein DIPPA_33096 [Diplonema papillatum]|nr:hypothetical protein DIPPA_33096 [Diplonema papillatum]
MSAILKGTVAVLVFTVAAMSISRGAKNQKPLRDVVRKSDAKTMLALRDSAVQEGDAKTMMALRGSAVQEGDAKTELTRTNSTQLVPHLWFNIERSLSTRRGSRVANVSYDAVNATARGAYLDNILKAASNITVRSAEFIDLGDDASIPPNAINATIATDSLAAAGISRLWFECRLISPITGAFVACFAKLLERGSEQVYGVSAPFIPHAGVWHLVLMVAQVGERGAYPRPGDIVEGVQFAAFECHPRPVMTFQLAKSAESSCGYWTICEGYDPFTLFPLPGVKENKSKCLEPATWHSCHLPPMEIGKELALPSKVLATADHQKHLVLLGDSHQSSWRTSAVAAAVGKWLGFLPVGTIQRFDPISYVSFESIEPCLKLDSRIPGHLRALFLEVMIGKLRGHLEEVIAELAEKRGQGSQTLSVVVVVNFGTWDLRDVSVGEYCGRIEKLHRILRQESLAPSRDWGPGVSVRWVWRTVPAYSYGGTRWRDTDLRTNENIMDGNACAVKALPDQWRVHDTFAYTYPSFLGPCDSHHFLCPPNRQRKTADCVLKSDKNGEVIGCGCPGKYDLLDFLYTQMS